MNITIIAALAKNRVIGADSQLPWHLPADLARFKQLTHHKPIIMGRKTYESIGKLLPNRYNIILTKTKGTLITPGCQSFPSLSEALQRYEKYPEIMIIGGQSVFEAALPLTQKMYLTLIHHTFKGDTYFPTWHKAEWYEVARKNYVDKLSYSFVTLERL